MVLIVTFLLLMLVLLFVGYPLLRPSAPEAVEAMPPAARQRERLLAEREQALSTLKELEFEHSIGNLSDDDYAALQGAHRHKAVAILRELDAAATAPAATPASSAAGTMHSPETADVSRALPLGADDPALDARLEDEITRARERLAVRSRDAQNQAERVMDHPRCPACGSPHAPDARFCLDCGRLLGGAEKERTGRVQEPHEA